MTDLEQVAPWTRWFLYQKNSERSPFMLCVRYRSRKTMLFKSKCSNFLGYRRNNQRLSNSLDMGNALWTRQSIAPPMAWDKVPTKTEMANNHQSRWHGKSSKRTTQESFLHRKQRRNRRSAHPPRQRMSKLWNTIPLVPSDYQPIRNLSYGVPTASVLDEEEWRLISSTISPFKYESGTGNQNYAIQLDYGLSDTPNFSFLQHCRWSPQCVDKRFWYSTRKFLGSLWRRSSLEICLKKNWSFALNGSIESWTVGSGGSDSRGNKSKVQAQIYLMIPENASKPKTS